MMLVHGEHRLEVYRPFTPGRKTVSHGRISNIADKGKGALITFDVPIFEIDDAGKKVPVCMNQFSLFVRGLGGFGHKGGPGIELPTTLPTRKPDVEIVEKTIPNQAFIYRLSGDYNPLHIDPNMAAMGGFEKPILHGLCTFGLSAKAVYQTIGSKNPNVIKAVSARFTSHVFPGESVRFKLWKEGTRVIVSGETVERGKEVLRGLVELSADTLKPKL
jgi:acyl dehydratase